MKEANQQDTVASLSLKAPAKINLFLKILRRRPDGYHEIESLMQKIELFDTLHFFREGESITLSCPDTSLPEDEGNLVYRAAQAFFSFTGIKAGVKIVLEKKIPIAAGLGGGSSDAAAAVLGLNRLFETGLDQSSLSEIAGPLGADVEFFVRDCSAALASGIGDHIQKVESPAEYTVVLVNPGFGVSTKWAYENFPLTSNSNPYILARDQNMSRILQGSFPGICETLGNDLEAVTVKRYSEIADIKKELKEAGAAVSLMSGSGPTVFGLFLTEDVAQRCYRQLSIKYSPNLFLARPYIP